MRYVFETYHSYFRFVSSIFSESRYIQTPTTELFLRTLLDTCNDKIMQLDERDILYRAQKGYDEIEEEGQLIILPFKAERLLPKADKVRNGRVNSQGIPVLYLSDDLNTAISETRPWIQERISIATLRLRKKLKILDLSKMSRKTMLYLSEPTDPDIINKNVWADVSYAFSMPVNVEDQDISYIPTQVIGEYFKQNGFDGIKYKSLLADGNNYALFDVKCAEMVSGKVVSVEKVNIISEQFGNEVNYHNDGNTIEYFYISKIYPVGN